MNPKTPGLHSSSCPTFFVLPLSPLCLVILARSETLRLSLSLRQSVRPHVFLLPPGAPSAEEEEEQVLCVKKIGPWRNNFE